MGSDAKWYIDQLSSEQREYADLLLSMCRKYHICWSDATELERRFIEEITRYTFELKLVGRGQLRREDVRPAFELASN